MGDKPKSQINYPEQLCEATAGIIDELEDEDIIEEDRALLNGFSTTPQGGKTVAQAGLFSRQESRTYLAWWQE